MKMKNEECFFFRVCLWLSIELEKENFDDVEENADVIIAPTLKRTKLVKNSDPSLKKP